MEESYHLALQGVDTITSELSLVQASVRLAIIIIGSPEVINRAFFYSVLLY